MADCIFCRIVAGESPADKLRETEHALAFLDTTPATQGHALVVPTCHRETISDAGPAVVADVFRLVRDTVEAIEDAVDPDGVTVIQSNDAAAGQEVPHLHVHVIPRWAGDAVEIAWPHETVEDQTAVADAVRAAYGR